MATTALDFNLEIGAKVEGAIAGLKKIEDRFQKIQKDAGTLKVSVDASNVSDLTLIQDKLFAINTSLNAIAAFRMPKIALPSSLPPLELKIDISKSDREIAQWISNLEGKANSKGGIKLKATIEAPGNVQQQGGKVKFTADTQDVDAAISRLRTSFNVPVTFTLSADTGSEADLASSIKQSVAAAQGVANASGGVEIPVSLKTGEQDTISTQLRALGTRIKEAINPGGSNGTQVQIDTTSANGKIGGISSGVSKLDARIEAVGTKAAEIAEFVRLLDAQLNSQAYEVEILPSVDVLKQSLARLKLTAPVTLTPVSLQLPLAPFVATVELVPSSPVDGGGDVLKSLNQSIEQAEKRFQKLVTLIKDLGDIPVAVKITYTTTLAQLRDEFTKIKAEILKVRVVYETSGLPPPPAASAPTATAPTAPTARTTAAAKAAPVVDTTAELRGKLDAFVAQGSATVKQLRDVAKGLGVERAGNRPVNQGLKADLIAAVREGLSAASAQQLKGSVESLGKPPELLAGLPIDRLVNAIRTVTAGINGFTASLRNSMQRQPREGFVRDQATGRQTLDPRINQAFTEFNQGIGAVRDRIRQSNIDIKQYTQRIEGLNNVYDMLNEAYGRIDPSAPDQLQQRRRIDQKLIETSNERSAASRNLFDSEMQVISDRASLRNRGFQLQTSLGEVFADSSNPVASANEARRREASMNQTNTGARTGGGIPGSNIFAPFSRALTGITGLFTGTGRALTGMGQTLRDARQALEGLQSRVQQQEDAYERTVQETLELARAASTAAEAFDILREQARIDGLRRIQTPADARDRIGEQRENEDVDAYERRREETLNALEENRTRERLNNENELQRKAAGEIAIGGGFPLLFGAGPLSALGGGFGAAGGEGLGPLGQIPGFGALGGFGGSLVGSIIGQMVDQMILKIGELGKAFDGLTGNLDGLFQTTLTVSAETDQQYRALRREGRGEEADALVRNEVGKQVGDVGGEGMKLVSDSVKILQQAWDGVYNTVALTVGLVAVGFVAALAVVLRVVQGIFAIINFIVTGIGAIIRLIPGATQLFDQLAEWADVLSNARQQRLADLQKEIDAAKILNDEEEALAGLRAAGAGLTGATKTRFDFQVDALKRQRDLEVEIKKIREEKGGNTDEDRAKVEELVGQARRKAGIEAAEAEATVRAKLARETVQQERERADLVLNAYRSAFQLQRQAYDLQLAVIDQGRQEADYERSVADYRFNLEDKIAAMRAASQRKELEVANAKAQVESARIGLEGDAAAFNAGPGREADVIRALTQYKQGVVSAEAEQLNNEIEAALQIDELKRAARQEERNLDSERITMERQRDALLRSRVQLERQVEDYKMAVADYQRKLARDIADDLMTAAMNLNAAFAAGAAGLAAFGAGGAGGGASMSGPSNGAVFGETGIDEGTGYNAKGSVHGHLQNMDVSALKADAYDLVKSVIAAGTDVWIQGITLTQKSTETKIRQAIDIGINNHKRYASGARAIDFSVPVGTRVPAAVRGIRDTDGAGGIMGTVGRGSELAHLARESLNATPASMSGMGGGANNNPNFPGFAKRLGYLETNLNPRTSPGGHQGYFQFDRATLKTAKGYGIDPRLLTSSDLNVATPALSRFIQRDTPQAYEAIRQGDYNRADRMLTRWTSLPGGKDARDAKTQAEARKFLVGGSTGVTAAMTRLPNFVQREMPTWAGAPSATPSNDAAQKTNTDNLGKQLSSAEKLRALQKELSDLGKQQLLQTLTQVAEGERTMMQKENELRVDRAALAAITAGSEAENRQAELAATQAERLNIAEEITARLKKEVLEDEKLSQEAKDKVIEALEKNIVNQKAINKLEAESLAIQLEKSRALIAANNIREFDTAGRAESKGFYGTGAQKYNEMINAGGKEEEARAAGAIGRATQIKQQIAGMQEEINKLSDPMQAAITLGGSVGDAFSGAFQDIVSGSASAKDAFASMTQSIAASFLQMATQIMAQQAVLAILKIGLNLFAPGAGSAPAPMGIENVMKNPDFLKYSNFAGGGFTGDAPRIGGVDGIGGFPAILHPNETVIDHTLYNDITAARGRMEDAYTDEEVTPAQQAEISAGRSRMEAVAGAQTALSEQMSNMWRSSAMQEEASYAAAGGASGGFKVETIKAGDLNVVTEEQMLQAVDRAATTGGKQGEARILRRMRNDVRLTGVR